MKITKQAGPPKELLYFDDEVNLTPLQIEDVVEIFNTPLTGSYNWDYTIADNRIKKLYELGKEFHCKSIEPFQFNSLPSSYNFLVPFLA